MTTLRDAASAVVLRTVFGRRQVLLVQRAKPPKRGAWHLPGGKREAAEGSRDNAERELLEETQIRARAEQLLGSVELRADAEVVYRIDVWLCSAPNDAEPRAAGDAMDARWWTLDELTALELDDATVRMIRIAARHRRPEHENEG